MKLKLKLAGRYLNDQFSRSRMKAAVLSTGKSKTVVQTLYFAAMTKPRFVKALNGIDLSG